jgi:gliding motility-associated-like protein
MSNSLCADTLKQTVSILNLQADAGNDTSVCLNTVLLTGTGHYGGLNYLWSHNSSFSDTLNNYPNDSTLNYVFTSPQYLFFKIEKSGCSDYDSVFIEQRVVGSFGNITPIKCHGDSNGAISVQVTGSGLPPFNYLWSNGQTTNPAINLGAGYYSLTITDADGCKGFLDTIFSQPAPLTLDMHSLNIPCSSACIGKAYANPNGGTTPYSWQWNDGGNQQINPALQLCAGNYKVTVTDNHGCQQTDTISVIDSSIYINFVAWADNDTIYKNNSTQLHSTVLGNSYIYTWTPNNGLSDPNISNPIASPTVTTTYIVETHDAFGCSWTDTITIYVLDVICDEPYIYVPNAFTPNGDGKNDILEVKSSVGYDINFMIYDKWGELVFESEDINKKWDGNYNGKKLEAGVYVYHLKLKCFNNKIFQKKGNITLIR